MKSSFLFYILVLLVCWISATHAATNETTSSGETWGSEMDESMLLTSFIIVVCGSVLVVHFVIVNKLRYLPESVAVVIYGIVVGIALHYINMPVARHLRTFDTAAFFLFILPCIIFETGFSLPKTAFFANIGPILAFAMLGTVISYLSIGGLLYGVGAATNGKLSYPLGIWESLVFGSCLSTNDPIATLAIFQALNVDKTLYMIVLGESILNDGVGVIIYRASYYYEASAGNMSTQILSSIGNFFIVFFGSSLLGVAVALLLSGLFRLVNVARHPPLETIFMVLIAYLSYVIAEAFELSGIMSVFWCGIAFNHYGAYSLSAYTTVTSRQLFRTAAFVCETCVFIYIGIALPTFEYAFDVRLLVWAVVGCLLGRALHVFPLSFLMNRFKKHKISWQMQVAIWFAGLRGAMAFSLAMQTESPNAAYIHTTTLVLVHITLFVFGCGTLPLLKYLKIKTANSDQSLDNITKQREKSVKPPKKKNKAASYVARLDEKYLKHWFRRPVQELPTNNREAIEMFDRLLGPDSHSHSAADEEDALPEIDNSYGEQRGDYAKVNTTDEDISETDSNTHLSASIGDSSSETIHDDNVSEDTHMNGAIVTDQQNSSLLRT